MYEIERFLGFLGFFGIFWDFWDFLGFFEIFLGFFGMFLGFIEISEIRDFWDFLRFFGIFWDFFLSIFYRRFFHRIDSLTFLQKCLDAKWRSQWPVKDFGSKPEFDWHFCSFNSFLSLIWFQVNAYETLRNIIHSLNLRHVLW